jgi:hypothetical protein
MMIRKIKLKPPVVAMFLTVLVSAGVVVGCGSGVTDAFDTQTLVAC